MEIKIPTENVDYKEVKGALDIMRAKLESGITSMTLKELITLFPAIKITPEMNEIILKREKYCTIEKVAPRKYKVINHGVVFSKRLNLNGINITAYLEETISGVFLVDELKVESTEVRGIKGRYGIVTQKIQGGRLVLDDSKIIEAVAVLGF
jgi:hypothetical protein